MPTATLTSILTAISADPGLKASISAAQIQKGLDAAATLDRVLLDMITLTKVNDDGRISEADMATISATLWKPENAAAWRDFYVAHGNDNGTVVSGFHWVQNDGGTLKFQGRDLIDTVIDAIYHYGFEVTDGRYVNEDGNTNETTIDVAGWLNFFLNGENIVYGTDSTETLGSGTYSDYFASARNETFLAGAGNDSIWADLGNDKVYGGDGNDRSGGGMGNDSLWGEAGDDTLMGDDGDDAVYGGDGVDTVGGGIGNDMLDGGALNDVLYGGDGNDRFWGGTGDDKIYADAGADIADGGAGNDEISGGNNRDTLLGGAGNDRLHGGEGTDTLRGGTGADVLLLWETVQTVDTIVFAAGDAGRTRATIDRVEGFAVGVDKIDLRALGPMTFEDLDYVGGGKASCYHDGRYLRIDTDGNGASDMIIQFMWINELTSADFIFA